MVADCFLSLKARVVRALLEFAKHLGEPTATPGQLPVHDKIRQEALAALANVAGENVSRIMSQNILGILFDMIKSPEATARYIWSRGALAIWDNRVVQHKGIKDYGSGRRILYRATMTA